MSISNQTPLMALLLAMLALHGCEQADTAVPLYPLQAADFQHTVRAGGSLFAVKSKQINAPLGQSGPGYIAYIAPEYSMLKPGDVVIRFEGQALLDKKSAASYLQRGLQFDLGSSKFSQQTEQQQLGLQQALVGTEFNFADRFAIDDITIRSRLEILDSLQNKDYLAERKRFLTWQQDNMAQRFAGESGLLEQQLAEQQRQLNEADAGLQALELRAPHAGMLVLETDWNGEKPAVGKMIFPGAKVASLPDLSLQQLKLQVAEAEAAGLAAGQTVSFIVLTRASEQLSGKVLSVGNNARSTSRRDPRKYIEVIVAPDQQMDWFVPGSRVNAVIEVSRQQQVLAVPQQAVFSEKTQSYVWKWQDGRFSRQPVKLGARGLHQVVVADGLVAGDQIALVPQQEHSAETPVADSQGGE